MNKILILLTILALSVAPQLQAKTAKKADRSESSSHASSGARQNLISISPSFYSSSSIASYSVFGVVVGYERAIGDTNGVIAQLLYEGNSLSANTSVNTIGLAGGFRWYLLGGGNLSGLYAAPMLSYQTSTFSSSYTIGTTKTTYTSAATLIKVAGQVGYQAIVMGGMSVGANFELGYTSGSYATVSGVAPGYAVDGISLKPSASVGWAF